MSNRIIEIEQIGYRIGDDASATLVDCVGTLEYTVKSVAKTRKCGLAEEVVAVMNTGTGTIKIEAHAANADNEEMLGMAETSMAVNRRGSRRPNVCLTAVGTDENGAKVLLAFPKAMITQDESSTTVDNGSTDIPYLSQEFSYAPDASKIGLYIKNEAQLPQSVTASAWMSTFSASTMCNN